MNAQLVRWPQSLPTLLLGGHDIDGFGERYLHLGGWRALVASVEHEHYYGDMNVWVFRLAIDPLAFKVRVRR